MQEADAPRIVSGPSPTDSGTFEFCVCVDGQTIKVTVSPLGIGTGPDEDYDLALKAVDQVEKYLRGNDHHRSTWYREAAQLRRASGKPPLAGNTHEDSVTLVGSPLPKKTFALFATHNGKIELRVAVFKDATILDLCDDWSAVNDRQRDAAITLALDWIVNHPDEARALDLDPELIRDVWR